MKRVRRFLGLEALAFGAASLVHAGILLHGYQHRAAMIGEAAIGLVLVLGLVVSLLDGRSTRVVGSAVQIFALLATLGGIFAMVVGIGPKSSLDVVLHTMFIALLIPGVTFAGAGLRESSY